jgi:hypothetical protein
LGAVRRRRGGAGRSTGQQWATRKVTDKEVGGATQWMDVRTGYDGRGDGNKAVMGATEREGKHRPQQLERV